MTGKKALERLKADPDLVAKAEGYCVHRVHNGDLQCLACDGTWADGSAACSLRKFERIHWTLYRRKRKERDVFKEPKPRDAVTGDGFEYHVAYATTKREDGSMKDVWLWHGSKMNDANSKFAIRLTRAEFAARAKPPFSWQVVERAK